jgi:hypothetical protein
MAETPSLPEIIEACIDRRLEGVHTACPGTIISFDADAQTCRARTRLPAGDVLEDVPVVIPGNWSSGDPVLLVFCEREFDSDLEDSGEELRHGLGAAIAVPLIARSSSGVDFVALAGLVISRLEAMQTAIDTHTHSGVTTGPGVSGIPTPIVWPVSDVAASKVKAR